MPKNFSSNEFYITVFIFNFKIVFYVTYQIVSKLYLHHTCVITSLFLPHHLKDFEQVRAVIAVLDFDLASRTCPLQNRCNRIHLKRIDIFLIWLLFEEQETFHDICHLILLKDRQKWQWVYLFTVTDIICRYTYVHGCLLFIMQMAHLMI